MAPKRKQSTKPVTKPGVLKPSQRFIYAKNGKLSKTNLQTLFADPALWSCLTRTQQEHVAATLKVTRFFGPEHPLPLADAGETFVNYFTSTNPVSPNLTTGAEEVEAAATGEVYFDMAKHLESFAEHLKEGRFDPKWMRAGAETCAMRARGDYDGFWQWDGETRLSEEGRGGVDEVRRRRMERKERGVE
jgi:hypothetical protein